MIRTFASPREALEHFAQIRRKQDKRATPEMEASAVEGACFVRFDEPSGLYIFGEIWKITDEEDKELMKLPHMRYVRLCKCYSIACEDGELGNVHVTAMDLFITREAFEHAREKRWSPEEISL